MFIRRFIYNLEFPSWCREMSICGYRFTRVPAYPEQLACLQHLTSFQSEYAIEANTGEHAITAEVELPAHEQPAVIGWTLRGETALQDILLLLSLFTGRDVFLASDDPSAPLLADPRLYQWGGVLRSSLPRRPPPPEERDNPRFNSGDLEHGLNQIYARISSAGWQERYREGHFLLLARQAFKRQPLEAAFLQCWTIWEHLYEMLSSAMFSKDMMYRVEPVEKVFYVLGEFSGAPPTDERGQKRLRSLAHVKRKLVHLGSFPRRPDNVHNEAVLFIRLTEFVIAKSLGL